MTTAERRPTQEERRTATRARVLDAAATGIVRDGYAAMTTRSVALLAGVSQGTVMHYFATREALLSEAMSQIGLGLIDEISALADDAIAEDDRGAAMIDALWERFRAPQGIAIGQLWTAAWANPDLTGVVAAFERRVFVALVATAEQLYPQNAGKPALMRLAEATFAMMRGLIILSPITDPADIDRRWTTVRPILLAIAAEAIPARP